jgi:thiamine biosynthesis lipoprotein
MTSAAKMAEHAPDGPGSSTFKALGTTVTVLTTDPGALRAAKGLLALQLDQLDQACSRFRADSELSTALRTASQTVRVSPLLAQLVKAALEVARFTRGAVDPTVGGAMVALGYDRNLAAVTARGLGRLDAAVPAPGWEHIEMDLERRLLRAPPGTILDLGASAKAFAADRAARDIAADLSTGVLVNLGGDISVAGPHPRGGWPIGLALDASTDPAETDQVVLVASGGLASSGTTVRTWRHGDRVLHHIVDPRTGDVASDCWSLATVAAPSCLIANAVSTAVIVAGEQAPGVLRELPYPSRLVRQDGSVSVFNGWPEGP